MTKKQSVIWNLILLSNKAFHFQHPEKQCFKKYKSICDTLSNPFPLECHVLLEWPLMVFKKQRRGGGFSIYLYWSFLWLESLVSDPLHRPYSRWFLEQLLTATTDWLAPDAWPTANEHFWLFHFPENRSINVNYIKL